MGFKVTVHKNGAKHGEAHYTSEAVAVGMAKKMKNMNTINRYSTKITYNTMIIFVC